MQTVKNRAGETINVTEADFHTLKDVVENVRSCGGGNHRERKVARRELRRRGYAWYVIFGESISTDPDTGDEYRSTYGPQVCLIHESGSKADDVWSRGCVSPGAALDRWRRNQP
jgi:hypothetical protein